MLLKYYALLNVHNHVDANMLKKDQTDIVKPHEVNDDELLQVHTQEYMSSMKVSLFIALHMNSYTPVHSYNILVITRILSLALDLGNN